MAIPNVKTRLLAGCMVLQFFAVGVTVADRKISIEVPPKVEPATGIDVPDIEQWKSDRQITLPESRPIDAPSTEDPVGAIDADTEQRMKRFASDTGLSDEMLNATVAVPQQDPPPTSNSASATAQP